MRKPAGTEELITASRDAEGSECTGTQSVIYRLHNLIEVACALTGKRASIVRPVLDAHSGIGTDWRLKDGGFAP